MSTSKTIESLVIGSLLFPDLDQLDFTGPFEVLSRIPGASIHTVWKDTNPVRDAQGLVFQPTMRLEDCPPVDLLHVPGGFGQQALMDDDVVLEWIRKQAATAQYVLSVCTGALICGAAGLLKNRCATTHWASFDLLKYFGATPVKERTVFDGSLVTTAGVTAGIDAALELTAKMRGDAVAQQIQLYMEYSPQPPFNSGTPDTAPSAVLDQVIHSFEPLRLERLKCAASVARRLGVEVE